MKYVYKTIPTHPQFEICDTAPMDKCIRTVDTKEYLNVYLNDKGYPRTTLKKTLGGDGKLYTIHHLIVETYIGKIPEGMECDHIDTNKLNINHNNIRIVDRKTNLNNPLTRKHKSEAQKKYLEEHPEILENLSKKHKEYFSNPENRRKHSEKMKKYFSNIENRKKHSELKKKYFSNIENRKKQSDSCKNAQDFRKKYVLQIDKDTGKVIQEYFGMTEAGRQTGIIYNNISECCNGKRKTAGGYLWRFKE